MFLRGAGHFWARNVGDWHFTDRRPHPEALSWRFAQTNKFRAAGPFAHR
jgi:hypothetical protein